MDPAQRARSRIALMRAARCAAFAFDDLDDETQKRETERAWLRLHRGDPYALAHYWLKPDFQAGSFEPRNAARVRTRTVDGYIFVRVNLGGKIREYLAHRLLWLMAYGWWPYYELDHINRDRADYRLSNLRDVPHGENQINRSNGKGLPFFPLRNNGGEPLPIPTDKDLAEDRMYFGGHDETPIYLDPAQVLARKSPRLRRKVWRLLSKSQRRKARLRHKKPNLLKTKPDQKRSAKG